MIDIRKKEECCGCYACKNACPVSAIAMKSDEEGFWYPEVDKQKCIKCGKCLLVCPEVNKPKVYKEVETYAGYSKDKNTQLNSSSGAIFAILAKTILSEGGAVCGAAFDEKFLVHHILIDDIQELELLIGTKYVQSRIENTYEDIKNCLLDKKTVLFSGTPCQVAGLKSFLKEDFDNLICVDLICHGVPSPTVWKKYLNEISPKDPVVSINFREKKEKKTNIKYTLQSGECILEDNSNSAYMKGFINNLFVRPSCYECKFKGIKRCSDITIGDFWGVNEYYPNFSNGFGVSSIIVHGEKGKLWIDKIKNNTNLISVKEKELMLWNECLVKSVEMNKNRDFFFEKVQTNSIKEVVEELGQSSEKKEKKTILKKIINLKNKF